MVICFSRHNFSRNANANKVTHSLAQVTLSNGMSFFFIIFWMFR
ncbi:hypothetical protein V6Z12_D11G213100 [Gossypium hirsutum]